MEAELIEHLTQFAPGVATFIAVVASLFLINYLLRRDVHGELSVSKQLLMLTLTAAGMLMFIFSLPMSETSRGQILSLLGIVVTAVIALSSTTFVANIMAGLMLRAVNSFGPGDFIKSETFFGKVTERGIFHTEIQTEDRDLTTLPNMVLVNNPVTVVRNSGTVITATVSLGYDISHVRIEEILKQAAEESGLLDAFVLIIDLGDFSVNYRVGGFTEEVSRLLSIKSNLRKNILVKMHESGIEIVSPNFMNQRALDPKVPVIPASVHSAPVQESETTPEDLIFDKADSAAEREQLKQEKAAAKERLDEIAKEMKAQKSEDTSTLEQEQSILTSRIEEINALISRPEPED